VFDPDAIPPMQTRFLKGVLSEGELALWIGREKHRKSSMVLLFSVSLALGKPFLGFATPAPLRVVILDYESKPGSLKRRYDAICNALGLTPEERQQLRENLHIVELRRYLTDGNNLPKFPAKGTGTTAASDRSFWETVVKDYPADVYVIDPMRCLHAEDENDSAIEALLSVIRSVFKAAVVIVHHMTKRGNAKDATMLKDDMRAWSDGARGERRNQGSR
jgi:RecA-family ATPase